MFNGDVYAALLVLYPTSSFLLPVFWTGSFSLSDTQANGAEGEARTHMPLSRRQLSKLLHYLLCDHCIKSTHIFLEYQLCT